jgi:MerR family transcriptional regulator, copper efflux regulator
MRIGELAAASGLSTKALRYYESIGLIASRRLDNGYRDYPAQAVELLHMIRCGQQLGFSLRELTEKLPDLAQAADSENVQLGFLREKLTQIDARMYALQQLRAQVEELIVRGCAVDAGSQTRVPTSPRTNGADSVLSKRA